MAGKRPWNGRTSGANIQNVRVYMCNKCGVHHYVKQPVQCRGCGCIEFTHFHSKAEAGRYGELALELKCGLISNLQMQTPFELHAANKAGLKVKIGKYVSDFDYISRGAYVVEDVKGNADTDLSAWKRKHVKAQYGVDVQIVRR